MKIKNKNKIDMIIKNEKKIINSNVLTHYLTNRVILADNFY